MDGGGVASPQPPVGGPSAQPTAWTAEPCHAGGGPRFTRPRTIAFGGAEGMGADGTAIGDVSVTTEAAYAGASGRGVQGCRSARIGGSLGRAVGGAVLGEASSPPFSRRLGGDISFSG